MMLLLVIFLNGNMPKHKIGFHIYTQAVSVKRYRLIYWKNHIVNEEIESGKDG